MRAAVTAWLSFPFLASCCLAQEQALTFDRALELARARATRVAAETGRAEEMRALLGPAARRLREDPVVELETGRRRADRSFADFEVVASQGLEPEALRRARLASAEAALATAESELADARRLYLGEVAATFLRALAAQERLRSSEEAAQLARDLLATVERRYRMGELTALDLNRARTAAARALAEREAAEGERLGASGELRALLGLAPGDVPSLAGALREVPAHDLPALLARLGDRPDLRALAGELREAEAQVRLGEALKRPSFGLRGRVAREEGADVLAAGVAVSLPLARRGQEERAAGAARARSLRVRLEAVQQAAETEVRTAFEVYRQRLRAAEALESAALPAVDDNRSLAERSFEAGEIDLGELLLSRREILETRLAYVEALLQARLAAAELETRAGVLQ
jgi:outer membrane protein, heavy metal efflux system